MPPPKPDKTACASRPSRLAVLDRLLGAPRALAVGEALFLSGRPVEQIHVVVEERLRLVRHAADGTFVAIHTARAGELVAEASIFSERYHCDAVAVVASTVRGARKADYVAAAAAHPLAFGELARLLAGQLQSLRTRLELRNIRSARERILQYVRLGTPGADGCVPVGDRWQDLAFELGMTREALYRALAALERDKLILRSVDGIKLSGSAGHDRTPESCRHSS